MQSNQPTSHSQSSVVSEFVDLTAGSTQTELVACPAPMGQGSQEHASAHPCLTRNYSITEINKGIAGYDELEKFKKYQHYKQKVEPTLSKSHYNAQIRLQHCIGQAALKYGRESLAVIDLTFEDNPDGSLPSFDYANSCLNSLLTNVFSKRYSTREGGGKWNNYLIVCERGGKRGRVHFHILVVKQGADFLTGSYKGKDVRHGRDTWHPNSACREEWKYLRNLVPQYGFGSHVRVAPLWDVAKGAKYFSKYVGKGHYSRNEEMRGRQLTRYGSGFKRWHSAKFSRVHGAPRDRRIVLAMLGDRYACFNLSELGEMFGSRWQYYAGDQMRFMCAMVRGRLIPPQTIKFLNDYLWNKFHIKLIYQKRGSFQFEVMGAYDCQIKEDEALAWFGRCREAPDEVFEKVGFYKVQDLRNYAWRNLCSKMECDAMGDNEFNDLPLVGESIKLKQYDKHETKYTTKQQDGGYGTPNDKPIGQLKLYRDLH